MTIDQLIERLESLRGAQDQTMRCGVISAIYGTKHRNGLTPTAQFLEDQIAQAREARRFAQVIAWEDNV
jgi:hypothetical protein